MIAHLTHFFAPLRRLYSGYITRIFLLAGLGIVAGLLEGVGISSLIPLFSLFVPDEAIVGNMIESLFRGFFDLISVNMTAWSLISLITILFIFKAGVFVLFDYIRVKIVAGYEEKKRNEIYLAAVQARWSYVLSQKIGYLENVMMADASATVELLRNILFFILSITSLGVYVVFAIVIAPTITVLATGIGILLFVVFRPLLRAVKRYASERVLFNKEVTHKVNEGVIGLKTIKTLGVEKQMTALLHSVFRRLNHIRIRQTLFRSIATSTLQPLSIVFIGVLFALSVGDPAFSFGAFVVTIYLIQRIFAYFERMQVAVHAITAEIPHAHHVCAFLDATQKEKEDVQGTHPFHFEKELAFRDVTFRYPNTPTPVLRALSFSIKKGERVGIVGVSGAGKTTVIDLILRLFFPESGMITIDDVPAQDVRLDQWRERVGYMAQDPFLMNDTIRNNIAFFHNLAEAEVIDAARRAYALEFIGKLPNGLDTQVGDRGVLLSGGQRQRIALARVLARKPDIIVLDEATSALDTESEAFVNTMMQEMKETMTMIVVTHRQSQLAHMDRIIKIEHGFITEGDDPQK